MPPEKLKIRPILPIFLKIALWGIAFLFAGWAGLWGIINFAGAWVPEPVVQWVREPDLLRRPPARRCGECHRDIFEAWKESRHARAWVSKNYLKDSENRRKEKCLPCHIPLEVRPLRKPEPRPAERPDGIYCVPCHFKNGAMHGPHRLFSPPHPTVYDQDYNASGFCGACHEKTHEQWQHTGQRETCQSCHMPRTRKRLTQKPPLSWLHRAKWVGDHRFLHGGFEPGTVKVDLQWSDAFITVRLLNDTVPHHVPTADNGDPRLYLELELFTGTGQAWERLKEILAPQQDTALAWKQERRFRYRIAPEVRTARLTLRYRPAWGEDQSTVLEKTFMRNKTGREDPGIALQ